MCAHVVGHAGIFGLNLERGPEKNAETLEDPVNGSDKKSSLCASLARFWLGSGHGRR